MAREPPRSMARIRKLPRARSARLLVAVGLLHGAAGLRCLGGVLRPAPSASMASMVLSDAVRGGAVAREYDKFADMEIIEDTNTADVVRQLGAIDLGENRCHQITDLPLIYISDPTRLLSISYAVSCLTKKE